MTDVGVAEVVATMRDMEVRLSGRAAGQMQVWVELDRTILRRAAEMFGAANHIEVLDRLRWPGWR